MKKYNNRLEKMDTLLKNYNDLFSSEDELENLTDMIAELRDSFLDHELVSSKIGHDISNETPTGVEFVIYYIAYYIDILESKIKSQNSHSYTYKKNAQKVKEFGNVVTEWTKNPLDEETTLSKQEEKERLNILKNYCYGNKENENNIVAKHIKPPYATITWENLEMLIKHTRLNMATEEALSPKFEKLRDFLEDRVNNRWGDSLLDVVIDYTKDLESQLQI